MATSTDNIAAMQMDSKHAPDSKYTPDSTNSSPKPPKERFSMDDGIREVDGSEASDDYKAVKEGHTKNDQKDMMRMGKVQEFKRNFRPLSALSFAVILQATWEFLLISNTQGLIDGGLAGLFWSYLWTFIGFGFVVISLAEMASMAPTSGGQYHWVSEFAPASNQRFLSYLAGWMSTLSWQAGAASGSYLTGTIVQALVTVNYPDYDATNWQGTLLVFAMVLIIYIANVYGSQILPLVQNFLLLVHIFGFMVVIIVLWVMAPHQSASAVFTSFTNEGGWASMGTSLMVGQISAIYGSLCSDATAHMAEEVKDAGRYVPISIFWAYTGNGIFALIFLITYLFSISSVDAALADPSGYPFIYVFRSAVSVSGVNALTILVLVLVIASNISFNASTSRQTFAFARDNGLPFARWLSHVDQKKSIPKNAILFSCLFTVVLSLINLGSSVAFNAIISLQVVALMLSYFISISCVLYRRVVHPETLPHARWSLGRAGKSINIIAIGYVLFAFFWSFWPNEIPVTAENFNWSAVIFVVVLVMCIVMYYVKGRHVYVGPVVTVRNE